MKTHKLLSLDYEVATKLQQEQNASALVNDLLIKHYMLSKRHVEENLKQLQEQMKVLEEIKKKEDERKKHEICAPGMEDF